jgi:hypothetical protein
MKRISIAHLGITLAIALGFLPTRAQAQAGTNCGSTDLISSVIVARVFTDSAYTVDRVRLGLNPSMLWSVRAINDGKDSPTCTALSNEIGRLGIKGLAASQVHFYKTDTLQLVTIQDSKIASGKGAGQQAATVAIVQDGQLLGVIAIKKKS